MTEVLKLDGVFEGGGVKGIGLVGAYSVIEKNHGQFENVAGTSAGAIVASLIAARYSAAELKTVVGSLDYNSFKKKTSLDILPFVGEATSLLFTRGMYSSDAVYLWIKKQLDLKGVHVFGDLKNKNYTPKGPNDLYQYSLHVITSDISNERVVALPTACRRYGMDPDKLEVASAVRMSMSIPFFFQPALWQKSTFVDGGMLSNFPVWLFDDDKREPERPTFGLKFIEPGAGRPNNVEHISGFAKSLVSTMMDAHDKMHVENEDFLRTIGIPTLGVQATDFNLTGTTRDALFASGVSAAEDFFKTWTPAAVPRHIAARRANPDYQRKVKALKQEMWY